MRPLHLFLTKSVGFIDAMLQFLLDTECDLERHWTDSFHQQFTDGLIDTCAGDPLAQWPGMLDPIPLAHIFRP
ncbi:MAG: hypothetical protein JOZ43_00585 [Acidobacteriales bacterium]|nr:hypothetical protein [Terriglobales bacterium]